VSSSQAASAGLVPQGGRPRTRGLLRKASGMSRVVLGNRGQLPSTFGSWKCRWWCEARLRPGVGFVPRTLRAGCDGRAIPRSRTGCRRGRPQTARLLMGNHFSRGVLAALEERLGGWTLGTLGRDGTPARWGRVSPSSRHRFGVVVDGAAHRTHPLLRRTSVPAARRWTARWATFHPALRRGRSVNTERGSRVSLRRCWELASADAPGNARDSPEGARRRKARQSPARTRRASLAGPERELLRQAMRGQHAALRQHPARHIDERRTARGDG